MAFLSNLLGLWDFMSLDLRFPFMLSLGSQRLLYLVMKFLLLFPCQICIAKYCFPVVIQRDTAAACQCCGAFLVRGSTALQPEQPLVLMKWCRRGTRGYLGRRLDGRSQGRSKTSRQLEKSLENSSQILVCSSEAGTASASKELQMPEFPFAQEMPSVLEMCRSSPAVTHGAFQET